MEMKGAREFLMGSVYCSISEDLLGTNGYWLLYFTLRGFLIMAYGF